MDVFGFVAVGNGYVYVVCNAFWDCELQSGWLYTSSKVLFSWPEGLLIVIFNVVSRTVNNYNPINLVLEVHICTATK